MYKHRSSSQEYSQECSQEYSQEFSQEYSQENSQEYSCEHPQEYSQEPPPKYSLECSQEHSQEYSIHRSTRRSIRRRTHISAPRRTHTNTHRSLCRSIRWSTQRRRCLHAFLLFLFGGTALKPMQIQAHPYTGPLKPMQIARKEVFTGGLAIVAAICIDSMRCCVFILAVCIVFFPTGPPKKMCNPTHPTASLSCTKQCIHKTQTTSKT